MTAHTVAVLGGGRSSEHEVSLASAASVAVGLRKAGYAVREVTIGRDGVWREAGHQLVLKPGRGLEGADVVFPVLHGAFGEDGTLQGLLECLDVAYVGAGVLGSALCMDKLLFKQLMARAGIAQVEHRAVDCDAFAADPDAVATGLAELGLPVFAKPVRMGSSVGIVRVDAAEQLPPALEAAFAHDSQVIVEARATGLEVECSVLGNDHPVASEPGEILLGAGESGWYDYDAKYSSGGMRLIVPARLPEHVREQVRELALDVFRRSHCAGLARVDFFVDGESVLVNELNTMPGFTETSVFAALFAAGGISYPDLLDRLVELGVERHERERRYSF